MDANGRTIEDRAPGDGVDTETGAAHRTAVGTGATTEQGPESRAEAEPGRGDGLVIESTEAAEPPVSPSKVLRGDPCDACGGELSSIRMVVDGNALVMHSCDGCDIRRWQLAGERIDLQEALNQVGEHAGRRRP